MKYPFLFQLNDLMKVRQEMKKGGFRPSVGDNKLLPLVYQIMEDFHLPPIKQLGKEIVDQLKMSTFKFQGSF